MYMMYLVYPHRKVVYPHRKVSFVTGSLLSRPANHAGPSALAVIALTTASFPRRFDPLPTWPDREQLEQGTTSSKLTGDVPLQPAEEAGTGHRPRSRAGGSRRRHRPDQRPVLRRPPRLKRPQCGDPHQDRLEESETLQRQAQNNSLAQFSASPDLQNEFVGAVIGAMVSSEDLSTQILNTPELSQKLLGELVPIIYQRVEDAMVTTRPSTTPDGRRGKILLRSGHGNLEILHEHPSLRAWLRSHAPFR